MFDLVTETEVFSAQRALANEMAPQIEEYIARAEGGLEELKQRERALQGKVSTLRRRVGMDGVLRGGSLWSCPLSFQNPAESVQPIRLTPPSLTARKAVSGRVACAGPRLGRSGHPRRAREGARRASESEEPPRTGSRTPRGEGERLGEGASCCASASANTAWCETRTWASVTGAQGTYSFPERPFSNLS